MPFVKKRYRTWSYYLRRIALTILVALIIAFVLVFAYVIGKHYGKTHNSLGATAAHSQQLGYSPDFARLDGHQILRPSS